MRCCSLDATKRSGLFSSKASSAGVLQGAGTGTGKQASPTVRIGKRHTNLSSKEKQQLLEQYDCESDEEVYPTCEGVCSEGGDRVDGSLTDLFTVNRNGLAWKLKVVLSNCIVLF